MCVYVCVCVCVCVRVCVCVHVCVCMPSCVYVLYIILSLCVLPSTRYWQLTPNKANSYEWDDAVRQASEEYSHRMVRILSEDVM